MKEKEAWQSANPASPSDGLASLARLAGAETIAARDALGRFQTGNSGGGRPKGAKNRLTELLLSTVVQDFAAHGSDAIARLRVDDPATYLRLVVSLVPRELIVQREQQPDVDYAELTFEQAGELADAERKRRLIRSAIEGS